MALGRWPDAIKTFVSVLIFFVRMKPYHTRSYQYGSVSTPCSIRTYIDICGTRERRDELIVRSQNSVRECTLSWPFVPPSPLVLPTNQ